MQVFLCTLFVARWKKLLQIFMTTCLIILRGWRSSGISFSVLISVRMLVWSDVSDVRMQMQQQTWMKLKMRSLSDFCCISAAAVVYQWIKSSSEFLMFFWMWSPMPHHYCFHIFENFMTWNAPDPLDCLDKHVLFCSLPFD